MKRLYLGLFLALLALQSNGQQTFTLDECIQYALDNSINMKNASLDEDIAKARVKETRGIGLPQVNGKVDVMYNERLGRFFATKKTAFGFSNLPEEQYPSFLPGLADDDVIASPQFFQLKGSGDASLRIDQLLFNSSYLVGLKAASAYRELSQKESEQTKEQLVQNVAKAFYSCLINKDRIALYNSNISRVDSLLRNTRAQFESGFVEEIDVDRTQVTLNNLTIERDKFRNLQQLGYELLKFQMNYPMDKPIEVEGDLKTIVTDESLLNEYAVEWDYSNRPDYQVLESNRQLQMLDIKNKNAAGMPSLSAFANLGYSTQSSTIGGIFKTQTNITDDGQVGPDKWYPYTSFGVSLNVPIFSGLQRTYQVQQAKINLRKIENGFISLRSSIDLEIKQATTNYLNAVEAVRAQQENQRLAEKVARVTKIKYDEGVGSSIEVVQAEADLREAQTNYYSALFDVMVSQIDLKKAYGKLIETQPEEE